MQHNAVYEHTHRALNIKLFAQNINVTQYSHINGYLANYYDINAKHNRGDFDCLGIKEIALL